MTTTHRPVIRVHYRDEMVAPPTEANYSKSPEKPARWRRFVQATPLAHHLVWDGEFGPARHEHLVLAHTPEYVQAVLTGSPRALAETNGLRWSGAFATSLLYTTGSLCSATHAALLDPGEVQLSPTSGFHHATPTHGDGFCTFSGQVVAAVDAWRRWRKRVAWIDCDEHHGNSLDDSVAMPGVAAAVAANVNPDGRGERYLASLRAGVDHVAELLCSGRADYVAFGHGADSHADDDLGGRVSTAQWVAAASIVYTMVRDVSRELRRPVPLVLAFFGGYRRDDYDAVLSLHTADVAEAVRLLGGVDLGYQPRVRPKPRGAKLAWSAR